MILSHMQIVAEMLMGVYEEVTPVVQSIIDTPGAVWEGGPRGVLVAVFVPQMPYLDMGFGEEMPVDYPAIWPDDNFAVLALVKGAVSLAECKPSEECQPNSLILATDDRRVRNWMGGLADGPFAVGSSGLTEVEDRRVSSQILTRVKPRFEALLAEGRIVFA
jgi:hypothetical protein